jgi:hypothetical protein
MAGWDGSGGNDSRYGSDLNGPSRMKIEEIVRFMFSIEALEDGPE